jgi:hypothetical protein
VATVKIQIITLKGWVAEIYTGSELCGQDCGQKFRWTALAIGAEGQAYKKLLMAHVPNFVERQLLKMQMIATFSKLDRNDVGSAMVMIGRRCGC